MTNEQEGAMSEVRPKGPQWLRIFLGAVAALVPAAILVTAWFVRKPLGAWLVVMLLLAVFMLVVGGLIAGNERGAFIDGRNKVSLSRLQTVLWTILVVSGLLVAALYNVHFHRSEGEPLAIAVPKELWVVLGISVTSLVGSPLIRGAKAARPPSPEQAKVTLDKAKLRSRNLDPDVKVTDGVVEATRRTSGEQPDDRSAAESREVVAIGQITRNATPRESSWLDIFQTEEVGNDGHLDLAKTQMFYFTIILVFAYAVVLGAQFAHANAKITALPVLDGSMVALLAISHGTYLTNKGIPHTQTGGQ